MNFKEKEEPVTQVILDLLRPDSEIIQKYLKSLFDKEEKYLEFLYAIEESIVGEFLRNKNIKDQEIISFLKHFIENIDKPSNYFGSSFEQDLYQNLIDVLSDTSITKHELLLCIRHILWSIDNRSWLDDQQAYIKWLVHLFDLLNKEEKEIYEKHIRTLCKDKGVPDQQVEAMLKNDFTDVDVKCDEGVPIESEYFALDDSKKLNFVVKNFQVVPSLCEIYFQELMEQGDYDLAEKLCKSILEIVPECLPIVALLGVVYKGKGNTILAKYHFDKVLNNLDKIPLDLFPKKERDFLVQQIKQMLKEMNDLKIRLR